MWELAKAHACLSEGQLPGAGTLGGLQGGWPSHIWSPSLPGFS